MRRLAWGLTALTATLAAVTAVSGFLDDGTKLPAAEGGSISGPGELTFSLMIVAFSGLGALLATRRPRNPIGWILCFASLALAVTGMAHGWYVHAEYAAPGARPAPAALLWFANWIFIWGFMPLMTALLLLFPDGKLPSRRWWPAGALTALALAALTVGYAFEPGALDSYPRVDNPLGVAGALGEAIDVLQHVGYPLFALAAIASAGALITRFRRSSGVERQQLRWMATAAALSVMAWFVNAVFDQAFGINSAFFLPIVLLAIPIAATVAILRYRLYDLGRIVNRTLVYGGLTLTLAATYFGLVLLIGLAVGESNLAIAASTLAIAALFRPARARIQGLVDRRFYRRRYDAARTLDTFSARLRDEVDLEAVGAELREAVLDTVQPAHLTLWIQSDRRTT